MPVVRARQIGYVANPARLGLRYGLAALLVVMGCESLQTAAANGDTRTISFHNLHTNEDLTVTYKRDGRYDDEAIKKINWILRDWRRGEMIQMDPRLIDTVWEAHREFNTQAPINIVCGYRAPATNSMLRNRSRSSGVAQNSQHTHGKAMDFYIPGVPLADLRAVGLRMQRGGVGFYPTSGSPFVHLDVGSIRHWPRMTHDQLARVFPDGRTVHIPSDGKPLAKYALALADVERRGSNPSSVSLASARGAGAISGEEANQAGAPAKSLGSLLASVFNGGKPAEEIAEPAARPAAAPKSRVVIASAETKTAETNKTTETKTAKADKPEADVRLPTPRPNIQLASATVIPFAITKTQSQAITKTQKPTNTTIAGMTPNAVIDARGFWQGVPETDPTAQQITDALARKKLAPSAPAQPAPTAVAAAAAPAPRGPIWPLVDLNQNDRAPSDLALSYAAQVEPVEMPKITGSIPGQTIATKREKNRRTSVTTAAALPAVNNLYSFNDLDGPWMRAMILAPDARNYMSVSLYGATDYTRLATLMLKPATAVLMTFSDDPHLGMTDDRFSGEATVFVATVTFTTRSSALLQ